MNPHLDWVRAGFLVAVILWLASLAAAFFLFSWQVATLMLVLLTVCPGAFLAVPFTKRYATRLGIMGKSLIEGGVEGAVLVLILAAVDLLTSLSVDAITSTLFCVWLYSINQISRAMRGSNVGYWAGELLPIIGFSVGAFVVFNLWLFVFAPLYYGY